MAEENPHGNVHSWHHWWFPLNV